MGFHCIAKLADSKATWRFWWSVTLIVSYIQYDINYSFCFCNLERLAYISHSCWKDLWAVSSVTDENSPLSYSSSSSFGFNPTYVGSPMHICIRISLSLERGIAPILRPDALPAAANPPHWSMPGTDMNKALMSIPSASVIRWPFHRDWSQCTRL